MERDVFISVDLGNSEIRMMAAERTETGKLNILAFDSVDTPVESILNGTVKKPNDVAFVINDLSRKIENRLGNKYTLAGLYVGINGRSMRSIRGNVQRNFVSSTEITDSELNSLQKELRSQSINGRVIIGVSNEEYLVDGEMVRNPEGIVCKDITACYLMTCARPEIVENIDKCFDRLTISMFGSKLAPVAIADAVLSSGDKENGCVVINFGAATTTVAVFHDGYLRHVAVVPFGGKHVTNDLKHLDLDSLNAERIKCKVCNEFKLSNNITGTVHQSAKPGEPERVIEVKDVMTVINARLDEIITLCLKEIERSGYKDKLKAGIIVSGGVSKMKDFCAIVSEKTEMSVKYGSCDKWLTEESVEKYSAKELPLLVGLLVDARKSCVEKKNLEDEENKKIPGGKPKKPFVSKLGSWVDTLFSGKEGTIEDE